MVDDGSAELKLISAVELKLALAPNDPSLTKTVAIYLCPLLLKLASPYAANKAKVEEVLTMLDNRLFGKSSVSLPFEALLKQFNSDDVPPTVKDRTVRYLYMASEFHTCDPSTFSTFVNGFSEYSTGQQPIVFRMICQLLSHLQSPMSTIEESSLVAALSIRNGADEHLLTKRFCDMMLLDMGQIVHGSTPHPNSSKRILDDSEINFLCPEQLKPMEISSLNRYKNGILKFIALPIMNDARRFLTALVASFDLHHEIQSQGSTILRRCDPAKDETLHIRSLYHMFLDRRHLGQNLQARLLQLLSKSVLSADDSAIAQTCITLGVESEYLKVRTAAIGLLNWIARITTTQHDTLCTRKLLAQLTTYLNQAERTDEARGLAYVAMGLLCKRDRAFSRANVDIVRSFFSALATETLVVRPSVEEALSSLMYIFVGLPDPARSELQRLLLENILEGPPHTHYTALRMTNAAFAFSDVGARQICLLSLRGEVTPEARQEALKGLNPYLFSLARPDSAMLEITYPSFSKFVSVFTDEVLDFTSSNPLAESKDLLRTEFMSFAMSCLMVEGLSKHLSLDCRKEGFQDTLMHSFIHDGQARKILRSMCQANGESEFQTSIDHFQLQVLSMHLHSPSKCSAETLLHLLILRGDVLASIILRSQAAMVLLKRFTTGSSYKLNAQIYSIVVTVPENEVSKLDVLCNELLRGIMSRTKDSLTSLDILANIMLRLRMRGRQIELDYKIIEEYVLSESEKRELSSINEYLATLSTLGLSREVTAITRIKLIDRVIDLMKEQGLRGNPIESHALALGALSTDLEPSSKEMEKVIQALLEESNIKPRIEDILAKGQALACCIGRWQSKALQDDIDVPVSVNLPDSHSSMVSMVLDKLLAQARAPRPQDRRGACLRLISVIQLLNLPEINQRLTSMHSSFLSLLSDHDEYIVESANKGIQIVYDRCDSELKDELLAQLFSTMTSDSIAKQANVPVTAETEIFQPGSVAIDTGASESSLTTYKDICNLAIEAGNNSLVYSFLNIASSSSMWSTRRGVALGLGSLLTQKTSEHVVLQSPEMLHRLLPKLFRYKHDPSTKVANAMDAIYQQLFPDPKSALEQNFVLVCSELCKGLSDQAWRVRESSARAMISLFAGRSLTSVDVDLEQIWSLSFRVLDDVKETVRMAGMDLCQSFSNQVLKSIQRGQSNSKAQSILEAIIPLLLKHLRSLSKDISSFALKTLLRITKDAGDSIHAHIPSLVEEYLLLTSNMEPELINYLSFHAAKYNITEADLDKHRLASMRANPLIDALEQCIDKMDESAMEETVGKVCQVIRQTSGLPTKAATSRFLISLTVRAPRLLEPFADSLLQALSSGLKDRSQTVVQTHASCIGYLARIATTEKLVNLINFASKTFFDPENQTHALGLVIKSISQNANDKFKSMASLFYPLCFLALHNSEEQMAALFRGIWEDNAGSANAIKLYLPEILPLVQQQLTSPAWRIKQMSASAIAEIAEKVDLGPHLEQVLSSLLEALKGKSWTGKEAVLKALVALVKRDTSRLAHAQICEIRNVMFREAKRTNMEYRRHALVHLSRFVDLDQSANLFPEILDIVDEMIGPATIDEDSEDVSQPLKLLLIQNSISCLIHAFNPSFSTAEDYRTILQYCIHQASLTPWNVKSQIIKDLNLLFQRISEARQILTEVDVKETWKFLVSLASDASYQSLREEASKTIKTFFTACARQRVSLDTRQLMRSDLERLIREEPSTIVQAMLRTCGFPS